MHAEPKGLRVFDSRRVLEVIATAIGAAVLVAVGAGPALAQDRSSSLGPEVTAVVALAGPRPITVAGVSLIRALPHVDAEVVRGTAEALDTLAHTSGVLGVRGDEQLRVPAATVPARSPAGRSTPAVYASQAVGGVAGMPTAGTGVNVAVLDTGLTGTPALNRSSGRVTDGVDVSGLPNAVSTSGKFTDGYGHGTFLSSLIAGGPAVPGGPAVGVAPGARIVVVKVANNEGDTSLAQVLAGMDWVAAHAKAIEVLTVALSRVPPTWPHYGADPLTTAVAHVAASGVLPVVAVGNNPGQVGSPGDEPAALTVGAANTSRGRVTVAPFSGSGNVDGVNKPDLVAPGMHLLGELPRDSLVRQENYPDAAPSQQLFRGSGTSMAAAVASGVAAIYFSEHPRSVVHPAASVLQAKASLRAAARPLNPANDGRRAGAGLITIPNQVVTGSAVNRWANESSFNLKSWDANAWPSAAYLAELNQAWSAPAWSASTWSASTWSASTWSASTWSA
ncbi:MAG: S8 family serine peptidase, partial [Mycobacteriales bacterium]